MRDTTLQEALQLAGRYPDAACWRQYRRKVLGTPKPLPDRFKARLAATAAEDPLGIAQIVIHTLRAAQQQEVEL